MPTFSQYPYSLLKRILHTKIHGRADNINSVDTNTERDLINSAVRVALSDIDFRGTVRESTLSPSIAQNQFEYALPADVKRDAIMYLKPQSADTRGEFEEYNLVSNEEFDRRKNAENGIFTITNNELTRALRISALDVDDKEYQVDAMEDTEWNAFPANSVADSDVKVDNDDYLQGEGSIRFQTTSDSTDSTVGIQKTAVTAFDISNYLARGQAFVDAKLTVADTGIHQISLRLGSDSDNYYQINDSNQNDCSIFQAGWNKIRWDFNNKTAVGAPVDTAIDYAAIFWSRDTTTAALLHQNDTDWGFDNLILRRGQYFKLGYYSRYFWQDTVYALSENSTHDSHALMVQNDELEVIMAKAAELASAYLRDYEDVKYYTQEYQRLKTDYLMKNPSNASVFTSTRYNFSSLEVEPSDSTGDTDNN